MLQPQNIVCLYIKYGLLITWPTANHTPWKQSPDQALNCVIYTYLYNNQTMHIFGTLALTWTLSATQNRWEKYDVAIAPWQNRLGARSKHTGMCLAVVHMISNKALRDHLAGFNVAHLDDAVMVSAAECTSQILTLKHLNQLSGL